jgi:DNA-binding XRE family transcriptional regulator
MSPIGKRILGAIGRESITSLARRIGVSRTTVQGWLAGRYQPNWERLAVISAQTGIPVETLTQDIFSHHQARSGGTTPAHGKRDKIGVTP